MIRLKFLPQLAQWFIHMAMDQPERFKVKVDIFGNTIDVYDLEKEGELIFNFEDDDELNYKQVKFLLNDTIYLKQLGARDHSPIINKWTEQDGFKPIKSDDFNSIFNDFYYRYYYNEE